MAKKTPPIAPRQSLLSRRQWLGLGIGAAAVTFVGLKFGKDESPELIPIAEGTITVVPVPTPSQATQHLRKLLASLELGDSEIPSPSEIQTMIRNMRKVGADVNVRETGEGASNETVRRMMQNDKPTLLMIALVGHSNSITAKKRNAYLAFINGLLENGADVNATTVSGHSTALHMAVTQEDYDAVSALLARTEIDLKAKDTNGYHAIDYAYGYAGAKEIEKLLLDNGAVHSEEFKKKPPETYRFEDIAPPRKAPGGRLV